MTEIPPASTRRGRIRVGVTLPERGAQSSPGPLAKIAQEAERLGFYAVELGDHIVIPESISSTYPYTPDGKPPDWEEWNEQLTTLSFIAGRTSTVRLITAVLILPYRHPLLAAKVLATLDVLSNGRLTVGVGAGWMREEFETLRSPPFAERGLVTDEYIRFFKTVWTEERPRFNGRYFSLEGVTFLPRPVQRPHPPIWVGGESPAAMRRAASLGDGWYPIGSNPRHPIRTLAELRAATERMRQLVSLAGRSRESLTLAYIAPQLTLDGSPSDTGLFVGEPDKVAADIRSCADSGVSYIGFDFQGKDLETTLGTMERFAKEVMPNL